MVNFLLFRSGGREFFDYMIREKESLRGKRRPKTICNYETAFRSFRQFYGKSILPLAKIDRHLMIRYETWLRDRGVCHNTSSAYMRSLQVFYLRAVHEGLTKNAHPFDRVFTGNAKTVKRSLSITDVHRIQSLKVPEGARREWRQLVLDVFLFCLYAGGMPLVDAAFLRRDQIQDDHIVYHRRKTGEQVKIPLTSEIRHLINQYKGNGEHEVFPLLNGHEHENHDDLFMRLTSRYNRTLNVLGKLAGVQKKLTHYVARHTWATIASSLAIPVYSISRCLGHTNVRTTQIYTTDLDNHLADEAIQMVQVRLSLK